MEKSDKKIRDEANIISRAKHEKAREIAKKLLYEGMDIEDVSNVTGLTEREVEEFGIDPVAARRAKEARDKQITDEANRLNGARLEGYKIGLKESLKEQELGEVVLKEVARDLFSTELTIADIAEVTGLPQEEIRKLK